jgi:hypothetical protein
MAIRLMSFLGLARNIKLPKLTHAAPIVSPKQAAQIEKSKARSGRRRDDEPELVGTSA